MLTDAYPLRRLSWDGEDVPISGGVLHMAVDRDALTKAKWRIEARRTTRSLWGPNVVDVEAETTHGDVIRGRGVGAYVFGRRVRVESTGEWEWARDRRS